VTQARAAIQELEPREAAALLADWPLWARAEQLAPPGDWYVWLILAGRGWGKTRTGAEFVRWRVESGRFGRIGLIGQTAADVRDVLVEGESGLLAISPTWSRPKYEPSKRRLTWPNGAIATTYSGDAPDQLRGPQHDTVWCLVGETLVLMGDGTQKRLADIRAGDYVQTRQGPKRVCAHALTKQNAEVYLLHTMDGRSIIGTADHPVWVIGKGFIPIASIIEGESVCVTHASAMTIKPGTSENRRAITTLPWLCSIAQSGKLQTARSPKGRISIISTATKQITGLITSNCLPIVSIARFIIRKSWHRIKSKHTKTRLHQEPATPQSGWNKHLSVLFAAVSIIALLRTRRATVRRRVSKPHDPARFKVSSENASIAESNTTQRNVHNDIVQGNATRGHRESGQHLWSRVKSLVTSVACFSRRTDRTRASVADHAPCVTTQTIDTVERLTRRRDVYDIAVEDAREFFANGILVHNCDELAKWRHAQDCWDNMEMGLRLGSDPRVVVTTTPRPIPLIVALRDDPQTARPTTNLSTHVNRQNVSERFVRRVITKYAGTRLGRQELDAEILDDVPGALWTRSGIEASRVRHAPQLIRVVVAVDVSSGGVDGETGIVGAGKDAYEHGYVLRDDTCSGDPAEWAPAVIRCFIELEADLIVCEKNQGGLMIEHVIRQTTVEIGGVTIRGANLPIELVWASRGKQTRAEPISILWSQTPPRGHYVGALPELEDQCCTWVPGEDSPDRMDAKVWALTALFPNEVESDESPAVGGSRPLQRALQGMRT
jgi:phage terminase large subunit-like protein